MGWFIRAQVNYGKGITFFYFTNFSMYAKEMYVKAPTEQYKKIEKMLDNYKANYYYITSEGWNMSDGYAHNFNPITEETIDLILKCVKKRHMTTMAQGVLSLPDSDNTKNFYRHLLAWIGEQLEKRI